MTKIIDLDADLFGVDDEPTPTKQVKLFGREWTILCDLNSFSISALGSGDPSAIVNFLDGLIAEDQRVDFRLAISRVKNLTPEKLGKLINSLVEVVTERPTTPPSASLRGASKRVTAPKSRAASSSVRAVRSVR